MSERPFADIDSTLRVVRYAMEKASTLPRGSEEAIAEFGHCLMAISIHFSLHTKAAFPRSISDRLFHSDAERALDLFGMVEGFPGEMAMELRLAMAGLQIGEIRQSVAPARTRQGGASDLEALTAKAVLVGAADRLAAISGNSEAYKEELKARGLQPRTIDRYRREIRRTDTTGKSTSKFADDAMIDSAIHWAKRKLRPYKKI